MGRQAEQPWPILVSVPSDPPIPPAPRGWSEEDWRRSLLGDRPPPRRGRILGAGRGWLLPTVIGVVVLVLVILLILNS